MASKNKIILIGILAFAAVFIAGCSGEFKIDDDSTVCDIEGELGC